MGELLLFEVQVFFLQELSSLVFLALEEEFFFKSLKANAHGTGRPADEDMQLKRFGGQGTVISWRWGTCWWWGFLSLSNDGYFFFSDNFLLHFGNLKRHL